uniref:Uncharacterized protein n=1 Tax=Panagrolaimus davidi TaxID=227884 RepID=A0A914QD23_9BILA
MCRNFNGTSEIPAKNARLQKIVGKYNSRQDIPRREDFVTIDAGFISLEELKAPQWTVYSLDTKGAIFIELPKPLTHYLIDKYPFIFIPMFDEALRIAEMDLKTYISFGNELENDSKSNPPPKTLFFSNTARGASTLFGAMLQHDGHSIVYGEHPALIILSTGLKDLYWSEKDINDLLPATIKLIRKHIPSNQLFVIKTSSTQVNLVPFLSKHFPQMQHIFMFRKNGLNSVERVVARSFENQILLNLYNYFPSLATFFGFLVATEGTLQRRLKPTHIKEWSMLIYAGPYMYYKQNKEIFNFPIVWHDELMENPEKLNIPEKCISNSIAKMKIDSQADTYLSQKNLKDIKMSEMTPELKQNLQKYAEILLIEPEIHGIN